MASFFYVTKTFKKLTGVCPLFYINCNNMQFALCFMFIPLCQIILIMGHGSLAIPEPQLDWILDQSHEKFSSETAVLQVNTFRESSLECCMVEEIAFDWLMKEGQVTKLIGVSCSLFSVLQINHNVFPFPSQLPASHTLRSQR